MANISVNEEILIGLYSYDYVIHNYHRRKILPSPAIKEVLFAFTEIEESTTLAVVDKKAIAKRLADRLSEIAFGEIGVIIGASILLETFKEFRFNNPENIQVIFFENMDIPNINKLSLYCPDIVNTSLFGEYATRVDP